MSFSKTVSVFAALTTIFGAAATGWKLAQDDNQQPNVYEERIKQLEEQLKQQPIQQTIPAPISLPSTQVPQVNQLPPPTAPPPVEPQL